MDVIFICIWFFIMSLWMQLINSKINRIKNDLFEIKHRYYTYESHYLKDSIEEEINKGN